MKVRIHNYYFTEKNNYSLVQEVKQVVGYDFQDVELYGDLPYSYESLMKVTNLNNVYEIVDFGSRDTIALFNEGVNKWVRVC